MGCCQSPKQRLEAGAEGGDCYPAPERRRADNWSESLDCLMSDTLSIWSRDIGEYSCVVSVRLQNYSVVPPLTFMDSTKVLSEFLLEDK